VGSDAPLLSVMALAAALAGLHRFVPGLVELAVGLGGLLASLFAATDPGGAGAMIGSSGVAVVQIFGAVMLASALVRLLGSGSPREMARHLVIAVAALELSLVLARAIDETSSTAHDRFTMPAVLAALLFVITVITVRSREHGMLALGGALVAVQVVLVIGGSPFGISPVVGLVGSATFAWVASYLRSTSLVTPRPVEL
jgi:hypothetical protein